MGNGKGEEEVEITTHASADGPKKRVAVPKGWKRRYEATRRARSVLNNQLRETEGIGLISVVSGEREFGTLRGFAVEVEVDPKKAQARRRVPDHVEGVPVKRAEPTELKRQACSSDNACYNETVYEPTPGGVTFDGATAGSPFWVDFDYDGYFEHVMLTAAHVVDGGLCNGGFDDSQTVDQHCEDWGGVAGDLYDEVWDVVALTPTEPGKGVASHIERTGYFQDAPINGYVTEFGLSYKMSNDDGLYKTGIMTGTQWGEIEGINAGDGSCVNWDGEGVIVMTDSASGDSGAPVYDIQNGNAYIASIHSAGGAGTGRTDCQGGDITEASHGTAAYYIQDRWNGQFVPP